MSGATETAGRDAVDAAATIDAYFAMWNETDAARRRQHIERAWAPDARYTDPMLDARGHAELSQMVAGVQASYPGHRFRRVSGIDAHHDCVRFAWDLAAPDGGVLVAGIDVGRLTPDGRLLSIVGFFGEPPAEGAV